MVILSFIQTEWLNLRYQYYKFVKEYSSLFGIISHLRVYLGKATKAHILKNNLSTLNVRNVVLQQQYRDGSIKKYSKLVTCLLVEEVNCNFLLRTTTLNQLEHCQF